MWSLIDVASTDFALVIGVWFMDTWNLGGVRNVEFYGIIRQDLFMG